MPQAFPQSYTNQAVGQAGLETSPGSAAKGNPSAKGSLPNKGNIHPNGDVEVPGADGSDVEFSSGPTLSVAVNELSPAEVQAQPGGPLETIQSPAKG